MAELGNIDNKMTNLSLVLSVSVYATPDDDEEDESSDTEDKSDDGEDKGEEDILQPGRGEVG